MCVGGKRGLNIMTRKAVFAGSFDPVTTGHIDIIKRAAPLFDELHVLLAVNPDKKYMFPKEKRLEMLRASAEEIDLGTFRLICCEWDGALFEYCRKAGVRYIVKGVRGSEDFNYERMLALQTKAIDPSVETVFIPASPELEHISSTFVREMIKHGFDLTGIVPPAALKLI